jgi:hypothetical protein
MYPPRYYKGKLYCRKCEEYHVPSLFHINCGDKNGRTNYCKECTRLMNERGKNTSMTDCDRSVLTGFMRYFSTYPFHFKQIFKIEYTFANAVIIFSQLKSEGIV